MRVVRVAYIVLGTVSLVLGVVGIFVPLLPTTPFLLLTAYCYSRSSTKYYNWLISQPRLGKYILDYNRDRTIPFHVKVISLSLLWASILYCTVFVLDNILLRLTLLAIVGGVTVHIVSLKSKR